MRALLLVMAVALAGCTFGETEAIDPDRPAFTLEVTTATTREGHCAFGGQDATCHVLTVLVDNSNNQGDLPVGGHVWEADDGSGGLYAPPQVEGPDAIASGSTRSITLSFSVDEDVPLRELPYEGQRGEASAPISYA